MVNEQDMAAYIEYMPGERLGDPLRPVSGYGLKNYKYDSSTGKSPIRRMGPYELPRYQYLPWHPKDRTADMPTEMPQELRVPPNVGRNSQEFQMWLAARGEWERYLSGGAITPEEGERRQREIEQWEIQEELRRERKMQEESLREERKRLARENARRMARGLPTIEDEKRMAEEKAEREKREAERSKYIEEARRQAYAMAQQRQSEEEQRQSAQWQNMMEFTNQSRRQAGMAPLNITPPPIRSIQSNSYVFKDPRYGSYSYTVNPSGTQESWGNYST